jgi:predicted transcriptional regulator of viral defense system
MNARDALGRLRVLRVPAVTTADTAAVLGISIEAASHTLRRLGVSGLVSPVRKGLWALRDRPDPLALAEYITAPYPSYVSLQSALYLHGMVDQIPGMIYLVSLARSGRVRTKLGTYSVHHVRPEFFGGAQQDSESGIKLASPEKALVDFLYLSPTRSRLFAALPELELPKSFSTRAAQKWVALIPSGRMRTIVERELNQVLAHVGSHALGRGRRQ